MSDPNTVRLLGKLCTTFHNVTYYAPEMARFRDVGVRRYWHGYLAYRSAPMGQVPASVVTATFYNFAPTLVGEAIPSVWKHVTPESAMTIRDDAVDASLRNGLGAGVAAPDLDEATSLIRRAMEGVDVTARALYAAHTEMDWPTESHMALHHACTLWREHRGDGHNIALAHAGLNGIDCHVLLAGRGIADAATIEKIRGWSRPEWDQSLDRLVDRGLLGADGRCTDAGLDLRRGVEDHTDELSREPVDRLGAEDAGRLAELLEPLVGQLVESGAVSATWPPKQTTVDRLN